MAPSELRFGQVSSIVRVRGRCWEVGIYPKAMWRNALRSELRVSFRVKLGLKVLSQGLGPL